MFTHSNEEEYNRNRFFQDTKLFVSVTGAFFLLDVFLKWITNLRGYAHLNDWTVGDWVDICVSSFIADTLLLIAIVLKNKFNKTPSMPFSGKEIVFPFAPSSVFFGFELLFHFFSNLYGDKDHLYITSTEYATSGISAGLYFSLLMTVTIFLNYLKESQKPSMAVNKISENKESESFDFEDSTIPDYASINKITK